MGWVLLILIAFLGLLIGFVITVILGYVRINLPQNSRWHILFRAWRIKETITQVNTKPLTFGYPFWNKITFLLLFIPFGGLFIAGNINTIYEYTRANIIQGTHNYGAIGLGYIGGILGNIGWIIFFILMIDFFVCKLFGRLTITPSELIYNPGGFIWRWFWRRRLPWQDYKFYLHYYVDIVNPKEESHLYSYAGISGVEKKSNKVRFKFKSRYPEFMGEIVKAVENICPDYERVENYTFWNWLGDKIEGW
ncbi:MAG: hypothetical protein PHX21_11505 [bacterium]|nr:hypothetical protein [bacterium]